ncbi:uncharacterized protein BYT42DRAFT_606424 [Radiomyces spectabilis]|uniref:uncharacterized protein n=1 Tax=Radiomyces spectabilis TaxID=64574 RepID=UPI00221EA386|nr:uncharacterized protein BYT42DRAFT_606424 [Radiomyces spectabilis]KAI8374532.1 hypothetical protein BYT42DRAFT_606424 [Radiomyces spectabilis]
MAENTSENTIFTYQMPACPGSDRLGKILVKNDFVKIIIYNALFDEPRGTFRVTDGVWVDCFRSDVVYEPLDLSQPMVRAIRYSTFAYDKNNKLPIVLILNTESTSIDLDSASLSPTLGGYLPDCKYWATKAVLINARTVNAATSSNTCIPLAKFIMQKESCFLESSQ